LFSCGDDVPADLEFGQEKGANHLRHEQSQTDWHGGTNGRRGKQSQLPVSLDTLTNQLGSDKILTDTESGKRFITSPGQKLDGLPSNSVLAYSPTDKKGRAVLFADGASEVINGALFRTDESRSAGTCLRKRFCAPTIRGNTGGGRNRKRIYRCCAPIAGQLKAENNRKN